MDKKTSRQKRAAKTRHIIRSCGVNRLTIHRTPRHIYAQVFTPDGSRVLASASTLHTSLRDAIEVGGNINAAKLIGKEIAAKALAAGITQVAFDRSGFKYHGRVKALADAAREAGLSF